MLNLPAITAFRAAEDRTKRDRTLGWNLPVGENYELAAMQF
jgi:hypothetical protein